MIDVTVLSDTELNALWSALTREQNRRSPRPKHLDAIAKMVVGESRVFDTWTKFHHCYRVRARLQLGLPDAQWTSRQTREGVEVTRIR